MSQKDGLRISEVPPRHPLRGRKRPVAKSLDKKRLRSRNNKYTLKKADAVFSLKIRARDKHCQFPGCKSTTRLQCSHYIGRATKSTRFDEDNCITLCWYHHYGSKLLGLEYQKQRTGEQGYDGQYTLLMKKRLTKARWAALMARSKYRMRPKEIKSLVQSVIDAV